MFFKVPHIFSENRRKAKINDKSIQLLKLEKEPQNEKQRGNQRGK